MDVSEKTFWLDLVDRCKIFSLLESAPLHSEWFPSQPIMAFISSQASLKQIGFLSILLRRREGARKKNRSRREKIEQSRRKLEQNRKWKYPAKSEKLLLQFWSVVKNSTYIHTWWIYTDCDMTNRDPYVFFSCTQAFCSWWIVVCLLVNESSLAQRVFQIQKHLRPWWRKWAEVRESTG